MSSVAPDRRALATRALGVTLVAAAMWLVATQQASAVKTYQCQHPLTTGEEAFNLKNVSPKTACVAVRALAGFIRRGERAGRLYKCVGLTESHPGYPVLKIHRFDGWNLHIRHRYEFVMSRGKSAFTVGGTDFPLNCT
jgi:hypothetical protein